jgi:hypothetical protein
VFQATVIQDFFTGMLLFLPWFVLATIAGCIFVWSNRKLTSGSEVGGLGMQTIRMASAIIFVLLALSTAMLTVIIILA